MLVGTVAHSRYVQLAQQSYGHSILTVLAERYEWIAKIDTAFASIFTTPDAGFSSARWNAIVARIAADCANKSLREALLQLTTNESTPQECESISGALDNYLALLFSEPAQVTKSTILRLSEEPLTIRQIIRIAQAATFIGYLDRVLCGLAIFSDPTILRDEPRPRLFQHAGANHTMRIRSWEPWLPALRLDSADAEQRNVLEACGVLRRDSAYFRLLAHDPHTLSARSLLYNAILFDARGLSRPEREFATVAVSRFNGCTYCTSGHARRYAELKHSTEFIEDFLSTGRVTPGGREAGINMLACKISSAHDALSLADGSALSESGFTLCEQYDLLHATALFGWANRLMLTLGEPHFAE
jgi:uncharacterized peroxidase-related enzyme